MNTLVPFSTAVLAPVLLLATGAAPLYAESSALPTRIFGGLSLVSSNNVDNDLHGGVFAIDVGVSGPLTLVFDVSTYRWSSSSSNAPSPGFFNESSLLAGPAVFFPGRSAKAFLQTLVGVHHFRDENHVGVLLGGGLDFRLGGGHWWLRSEVDYLRSHRDEPLVAGLCAIGMPDCFGNGSGFTENEGRFSLGIVYSTARR